MGIGLVSLDLLRLLQALVAPPASLVGLRSSISVMSLLRRPHPPAAASPFPLPCRADARCREAVVRVTVAGAPASFHFANATGGAVRGARLVVEGVDLDFWSALEVGEREWNIRCTAAEVPAGLQVPCPINAHSVDFC